MVDKDNSKLKTHLEFLNGNELVDETWRRDRGTTRTTRQMLRLGKSGERGPLLYKEIGNALSIIGQASSCQWGCRGGDHIIENIMRRCVNFILAGLRLAMMGYYEESLALVRGVSESTNLLQLFSVDPAQLMQWTQLSSKERWRTYGPAAVRKLLVAIGQIPTVDEDTYSEYCEIGVHLTPAGIALSHDLTQRVYIGPHFSEMALLLVLNEIAWHLAPLLRFLGHLLKPDDKQYLEVTEAAQRMEMARTNWLRITNYKTKIAQAQQATEDWERDLYRSFSTPLMSVTVDESMKQKLEAVAGAMWTAMIERKEADLWSALTELLGKGRIKSIQILYEQEMCPKISQEQLAQLRYLRFHGPGIC